MFHDQVSSTLSLQPLLCNSSLAEPGDELTLVAQFHDVAFGTLQSESPPGKFTQTLNLHLNCQWISFLSVFLKASPVSARRNNSHTSRRTLGTQVQRIRIESSRRRITRAYPCRHIACFPDQTYLACSFSSPSSLISFAFSNIASASLSATLGKAAAALAGGLAEIGQGRFPVGVVAAPVKFEP